MDQQPQSPSAPSNEGALKTSEKGIKKSGKVLPIILILVALAGVGFGVYGMFFKSEPTAPTCPTCVAENPKTPEEQPHQEPPEQPEQQTNPSGTSSSSLSFSRSFDNVVNNKHEKYYNKYESRSNTKIYYYNPEEEKEEYYYINCNSELCKIYKENGEEYATIDNFQSKVRDYYYIGFGQAYGSEQLFFIMENGSVEYTPVLKSFSDKEFKSYGKIEGLNDIIKIHSVELSSYDYEDHLLSRGMSALAEDINGNFYDLHEILDPSE